MIKVLFLIRVFILIFFINSSAFSGADEDKVTLFTIEDFFMQIMENHPVAKQSELLSDQAKQELRIARGLMDPSLNSRLYRKELDGNNYFTLWDNTLKIPIWYGTDIKAGFERNSGFNVNGENYTPPSGLSYAGISIPIGQGLIIDQRRATIRQAQLLETLAEAGRISMINELLLQAAKDYWDWQYAYNKMILHQEGFELAQFRLRAVRIRALEGDLSNIDTVEAKMEMQNRRVMLSQSRVEYQNASLMISNYLWTKENTPLELTNDVIPATQSVNKIFVKQDSLESLLSSARNNHPELLKLWIKQDQLNIERRLLADKLKPRLNLEYNFIQRGFPIALSEMNNSFFSK